MAFLYKYRHMEAKISPLLLIKVVRGHNQIVSKGSQNLGSGLDKVRLG